MGLKGSGDIKKDLTSIAPEAWSESPCVEATALVDDGTGTIYQTICASSTHQELRQAKAKFLQDANATAPNATRYIGVMDYEPRKPSNKSYLRNMEMERCPPFTDDEIIEHGSHFAIDGPSDRFEDVCMHIRNRGVEAGLCKETSRPVTYTLARVMRTHILRHELFRAFFAGMREDMTSEFPSFQIVLIDGAESDTEEGVFLRMSLDSRKQEKEFRSKPVSDNRAGEADLRMIEIVHSLFKRMPEPVMVRSRDTDLIPILLLDVSNWPEGANVMLNLGPSTKDGPDKLLNVRMLRTRLCEHGTTLHKEVRFPAIPSQENEFDRLFVLMTILAGTDYVSKPPGLGWNRLWRFFIDIGHAFFFQVTCVPPNEDQEELREAWCTRMLNILERFVCASLAMDHKATKAYAMRGERYTNMKKRVEHVFSKPERAIQYKRKKKYTRKLMKGFPKWSQVMEEAGSRTFRQGIVPQDREWIRVYCAQVLWNYLYWHLHEDDSIECQPPSMQSVWGWRKNEDGTVVRAEKVFWQITQME